jgi:hypothetical protein
VGDARVALMTPLNSGIRLSFRQQSSIFFRNAELVVKRLGGDARMACPPLTVVGQRRRTAPKDEFGYVFSLRGG